MGTTKHFFNKANVLNSFLDQILLSVGNLFLSSNSKTRFDKLSMLSVKTKQNKTDIFSYSIPSNIDEISEGHNQEFFQIEYFMA